MSKAVVDDDYVHTVIGTRPYRAPEMLRRQRYGPKADLWSLGLVVFQMVWPDCPRWSGQYDVDVLEWCDAVAQAARAALRSPRCTPLVRLIAEKMLRPDPEERTPAADLCPLAADVVRQIEEPVASPQAQRDASEGEAEGESDGEGASDGEETTRPLNQATSRTARSLAPPPSSNLKRQRSPASNEASPSDLGRNSLTVKEKNCEWKKHRVHRTDDAFSPDGRLIVSGSYNSTVRVWDAATGAERRVLKGHSSEVNAIAFSPDGRLIVSGSGDITVRVWDVATGAKRQVLRGPSRSVYAIAFSSGLSGRHRSHRSCEQDVLPATLG